MDVYQGHKEQTASKAFKADGRGGGYNNINVL